MKKKSLTELISDLKGNENVVNWHEIEPREAKTRPMPESIDERIKAALSKGALMNYILTNIPLFNMCKKERASLP